MERENAAQRIAQLSTELEAHNHRYYVLAEPTISDHQFDVLLKELEELERQYPDLADPNSPTQRVGGDITKGFPTAEHKYPMRSLSNTYNREEVAEFVGRVQKEIGAVRYVMELKYDGVAIGLTYANGRLVRGVTRGDGEKGEEITANVRTVRSIPLKLHGDPPAELEARGEIFFMRKEFDRLNHEREADGEELYANPRNTAAGTLKQQDPKEVARRRLDCFVYTLNGPELPTGSHYENLLRAAGWGFKVPSVERRFIERTTDLDGIMAFIDH
ncbi:MAG: NAD-dependent DNA ligase LigA, partial [Flavobacteriales bacterium]|nr:NAD-dependent DNA ligase LigA [Flavobacteriales bacterium]